MWNTSGRGGREVVVSGGQGLSSICHLKCEWVGLWGVGKPSVLHFKWRRGGGRQGLPSVTRNASGRGYGEQKNPPSHILSVREVVVGRVSPLSLRTQVGGVVVGGKTPPFHISSEWRSAVVKGRNEKGVTLLAALIPKEKTEGSPLLMIRKIQIKNDSGLLMCWHGVSHLRQEGKWCVWNPTISWFEWGWGCSGCVSLLSLEMRVGGGGRHKNPPCCVWASEGVGVAERGGGLWSRTLFVIDVVVDC